MTNQPQLDALIAQIEQQRQSADRETIRQQLVQSGASPQLVEQALAHVYRPASEIQRPLNVMTDQPDAVARIRAYLEQHKHTYTRDALQLKLLEDGHDPHTVDLALAQTYGFEVATTGTPPQQSQITTVILTAMALFVLNYMLWGVIGAFTVDSRFGLGLSLIAGTVVLEIATAIALRSRNRAVSRGLAWGIAISLLPVVALALLFGICLAIIGGF
jgi:hypothetical protein